MTQRLMARRSEAGGTERKLRAAGFFLPLGNHRCEPHLTPM